MYKLFNSSWRDDAVVRDPDAPPSGWFTNPDRVREINHVGKYYSVPGNNTLLVTVDSSY